MYCKLVLGVNMIGKNILRIRKTLGITQEEISEKADISRQTLSKIENNKTEPNSTTLMKIARVLDIKMEEFFRESKELQNYRVSIPKDKVDSNHKTITNILEDCSFSLMNYQMLEEQINNIEEWKLESISSDRPEKLAKNIREEHTDFKVPIINPISIINKLGIRVYIFESKIMELKSFSGKEEYFQKPYIAINQGPQFNNEVILFNLIKELGHLLMHKKSYNGKLEDKPKEEEKRANTFASYFLIPDHDFRKRLEKLSGLHWIDQILYLKRLYRVSYLKIIRRLPDEGVIGKNLLGDFIEGFNHRYNKNMDLSNGLPPEPFPNQELDFTNIKLYRLVRKGLEESLISRNKAAEILSLTTEEMEDIINSWDEIKEIFINE